jgi:hypothetical protein
MFNPQASYCSCYGITKSPEAEACRYHTKPIWKKQEEDYERAKKPQKKEFSELTTQEKIERVFEMYAPKIVTVDEDGYLRVEQNNDKPKSEKETNT